MKNKTAVLLVVALVCGLGAAYLTSKVIADRSKTPQEEKIDVLVAKTPVPQYKPIKEPEKYFVAKSMNKADAPKGAVTKMEDLRNKRLKVPLGQDKVITSTDLLDDKNSGASLSGLVPEGYRAIAIKVSPDTTAGGFVLPHTKVDVIASLRRSDAKSTCQTILQDVLVLAVNNSYERDEKTQSMLAHTVTVALTPEDVMRISLAANVADLRLSLRPEGENKPRTLNPIKLSDVIKPTNDEGEQENPNPSKPSGTLVAGLPLPPLDKPVTEEKFEKPMPVWTVTIRTGDQLRRQDFFRNKNGDIVTGGDTKGEKEKVEAKKEDQPTPPATENKD